MLLILSPAKSMDTSQSHQLLNTTTPQFNIEADLLAYKMGRYNIHELAKLLKISPTLAQSTFDRYASFHKPETAQAPAILAYTGSVFKEIKTTNFSQEDFDFSQQHLRIVSVLYGLIRPLDRIKAYRAEYNLKLEELNGDLYKFWLPRLTSQLIEDTKSVGGVLINLASLDILPALEFKRLGEEVTIITPEFKSLKNGKYETIRTYTKMARGAMAHYILENRICDPQQLKKFEFKEYIFNKELSSNVNYIFTPKQ